MKKALSKMLAMMLTAALLLSGCGVAPRQKNLLKTAKPQQHRARKRKRSRRKKQNRRKSRTWY